MLPVLRTSRTQCGTMIPTKPIRPLTETDGGRSDRRRDHHDQARAPHVDAQARGLHVPQREHVEHARVHQHDDHRDQEVREDERDVVPARGRDAAEDERVDLLQVLHGVLLHERLQRGEEGADRDAREHEHPRPLARAAPEEVRPGDGEQRPREGRQRQRVDRAERAVGSERDRTGRAESGTGGRAEQVRIGERIAEDALVGAAREPEHAAHHQPEDDAGQPQLVEDQGVRRTEPVTDREERDVMRELLHHAGGRAA